MISRFVRVCGISRSNEVVCGQRLEMTQNRMVMRAGAVNRQQPPLHCRRRPVLELRSSRVHLSCCNFLRRTALSRHNCLRPCPAAEPELDSRGGARQAGAHHEGTCRCCIKSTCGMLPAGCSVRGFLFGSARQAGATAATTAASHGRLTLLAPLNPAQPCPHQGFPLLPFLRRTSTTPP